MEYGCIGERLVHSFSKEIHTTLAGYSYELCEVKKEDLESFMTEHNFKAINVTIPYKEAVIPYLYEIDPMAKAIGAVNTVVNKNGKLYGYNTDFYGISELISHAGIVLENKKVVILGTGGTAKTASAVSYALGAKEVLLISRTQGKGSATYEELYEKHTDAQIIINTTPVGMFPAIYAKPITLDKFDGLEGVIDTIYNPLRTELILDAKERGIRAEGGLYMLVMQAVRASEIFLDTEYSQEAREELYEKIKNGKENTVLIGMPSSGKSTVGKMLAKRLEKSFFDTDGLILDKIGMSIRDYFLKFGEEAFRRVESEVISECAAINSSVIATGGGAVLREENVKNLKRNGKIFFIDRPLECLIPTEDRPLAPTADAIKKLYAERYEIYKCASDVHVDADGSAETVAERILKVK